MAEDALQECFRIALGHLRAGRIDNPAALAAFLRGIALNVLSEQVREANRAISLDATEERAPMVDERQAPLETTHLEQTRALVRRLIGELEVERDRRLLWGHYVLDQGKPRLCRDLGLSAEHFDRVLHRARTRFRALARKFDLETER